MSNLPVLIPETVETKPLLDLDILVLDYANKTILVYDNQDFELMLDFTKVDVESILTCIEDHSNLDPSDPIYAINGFTFILVKDFVKNPIQCSVGTDNPSIPSSKLLFETYFKLKNELVEVLNIETGEITKYLDLDAALINLDVTYYDLLKLPVNEYRAVSDVSHYVFPVVKDNYIFRFVRHLFNWTSYSRTALEPSGLLVFEENDQNSLIWHKQINSPFKSEVDRMQLAVKKLVDEGKVDPVTFKPKNSSRPWNTGIDTQDVIDAVASSKDVTFVSEKARLLFYLFNTDDRTRDEGLGITERHYANRKLANEWRDHILSVIGTDNQDAVQAMRKLWLRMMGTTNLLDNHPKGLGKHIEVYNGECERITEEEIEEYWSFLRYLRR